MRYDYNHPPNEDDKAFIKEIEAIDSGGIKRHICPNCGTAFHTRWYRNEYCFCFRCDEFFTFSDMEEYLIFVDEQDNIGAYSPEHSDMDDVVGSMQTLLREG